MRIDVFGGPLNQQVEQDDDWIKIQWRFWKNVKLGAYGTIVRLSIQEKSLPWEKPFEKKNDRLLRVS